MDELTESRLKAMLAERTAAIQDALKEDYDNSERDKH